MEREPGDESDYGSRRVEAARRVLVDLGQVLASFGEAIVVVGGWVPDLLRTEPGGSPHIGSIDVDMALDVDKLGGGRYAELVKLLLDTGRYEHGDKDFQLMAARLRARAGAVAAALEVASLRRREATAGSVARQFIAGRFPSHGTAHP